MTCIDVRFPYYQSVRRTHRVVIGALGVALVAACTASNAGHDHAARDTNSVELAAGLGSHSRTITTGSRRAQDFFNQGLRLEYAFNHEQAIRSDREAVRADSECAMCWWGIALAAGWN